MKTIPTKAIRWLGFFLFAPCPHFLFAQLGPITHHSLEARIVKADQVFIGTIVSFDRNVIDENRVEYRLVIKPDQILKGKPDVEIVIHKNTTVYNKCIEQWHIAKTEFLWFYDPNGKHHAWSSIRLGPAVADEKNYGLSEVAVFAADLSVLTTRKEILDRAGNFLENHNGADLPLANLNIGYVDRPIRQSAEGNFLITPVNSDLQKLATELLESPGKYYRSGKTPTWVEKSARQALRHFPEVTL